jgi:hypothetical protein
MFRFTKKPSSESHSQYLAKITSLVQCRYRRRTDVIMEAAPTSFGLQRSHHQAATAST